MLQKCKARIYALFYNNNNKAVKEADLSEKPRVQSEDVNYDRDLSQRIIKW